QFVVVGADVLGIGGVEHQQNVVGKGSMQAADIPAAYPGSGRVVGVGQHDDSRARTQHVDDAVDVGGEIPVRRGDGNRVVDMGVVGELLVAVDWVDQFVAGTKIDACQACKQVVGAKAAADAL